MTDHHNIIIARLADWSLCKLDIDMTPRIVSDPGWFDNYHSLAFAPAIVGNLSYLNDVVKSLCQALGIQKLQYTDRIIDKSQYTALISDTSIAIKPKQRPLQIFHFDATIDLLCASEYNIDVRTSDSKLYKLFDMAQTIVISDYNQVTFDHKPLNNPFLTYPFDRVSKYIRTEIGFSYSSSIIEIYGNAFCTLFLMIDGSVYCLSITGSTAPTKEVCTICTDASELVYNGSYGFIIKTFDQRIFAQFGSKKLGDLINITADVSSVLKTTDMNRMQSIQFIGANIVFFVDANTVYELVYEVCNFVMSNAKIFDAEIVISARILDGGLLFRLTDNRLYLLYYRRLIELHCDSVWDRSL